MGYYVNFDLEAPEEFSSSFEGHLEIDDYEFYRDPREGMSNHFACYQIKGYSVPKHVKNLSRDHSGVFALKGDGEDPKDI